MIRLRDHLAHRGPDDAGLYQSPDGRVALGNRRLAILDPHPQGHQPLSNEDQTVWITYNGEIYNFRTLHAELKQAGHVFQSQTDTEVLIHGYEAWGIEGLLARLKGMFAFALYDRRTRPVLVIARDRLGIKPLYYTHVSNMGEVVFASEIQALIHDNPALRDRDQEALIGLLLFGVVPGPATIYNHIQCLPPGHYMTVMDQHISMTPYWRVSSAHEHSPDVRDKNDVVTALRTQLKKTVEQHLISDVPLGVFLSGGIDSGGLVAQASRQHGRPLTTLTITFAEQMYDEAAGAGQLARHFQTDHHEIRVTDADFIRAVPDILSSMDQPTNDGVNTFFVARAAHEMGLKVVLSGVGGDELFYGYTYHQRMHASARWWHWFYQCPQTVRRSLVRIATGYGHLRGQERWRRFGFLPAHGMAGLYLLVRGFFAPDQIQRLLNVEQASIDHVIRRFMAEDASLPTDSGRDIVAMINDFEMRRYLPDQLLRDTDVFSMAHSVEVRVPYLDHEVVESARQVSPGLKLDARLKKNLLVQALDEPVLYDIARKPKRGFSFPMAHWMRQHADLLEDMMTEPTGLDPAVVRQMWQAFRIGQLHWSRAWLLFVLGAKKW